MFVTTNKLGIPNEIPTAGLKKVLFNIKHK